LKRDWEEEEKTGAILEKLALYEKRP